jgi:hypothetical protein
MSTLQTLRAFGRDWILTTLGLYDPDDLEVASTMPAPPPDGCDAAPASAPDVPRDSEAGREYGGG